MLLNPVRDLNQKSVSRPAPGANRLNLLRGEVPFHVFTNLQSSIPDA